MYILKSHEVFILNVCFMNKHNTWCYSTILWLCILAKVCGNVIYIKFEDIKGSDVETTWTGIMIKDGCAYEA